MCTCICLPVTPFYLTSKPICGFFHPKNCTLLHVWGGVSFPPFTGPMSSSHTDEILKTRWFFSTSSNLWNWSFQSSIAQGHIQLSSHLYLIHAQRSDFLTVWHVGWDALFSCSNFFKNPWNGHSLHQSHHGWGWGQKIILAVLKVENELSNKTAQ